MEPTLPDGAFVAVAPLRRAPAYGSVVVVRRHDGTEHLKRIVATPGDRVRREGAQLILGADEFAVAGDNRARSTDSRHYGPVSKEQIAGVARLCYWPPRCWRLLPG